MKIFGQNFELWTIQKKNKSPTKTWTLQTNEIWGKKQRKNYKRKKYNYVKITTMTKTVTNCVQRNAEQQMTPLFYFQHVHLEVFFIFSHYVISFGGLCCEEAENSVHNHVYWGNETQQSVSCLIEEWL